MERISRRIQQIPSLDQTKMAEAASRLDQLTKPPGSLGKLEDIAKQIAGITCEVMPVLEKKAVIVMAADHGVCEEGISAFPAEVTPQMVLNFLNGGAAVNVLARHAGAEVVCVDIGVNADIEHPDLRSHKLGRGTANMAKGPAMTRVEAIESVLVGMQVVDELVAKGTRLFATGEMGIGNTTASAAILAVMTGLPLEQAVGRGTGINDEQWQHKQEVIRRAITLNQPDADDPIDVLAKIGGYEIGGLAGVVLGASTHRCPVVIDGFISTVAALLAYKLAPQSAAYMIASHQSQEQGHRYTLERIGITPMLHMDMRLGEGTGAVLGFTLIDAAGKIMREMATFTGAGVKNGRND